MRIPSHTDFDSLKATYQGMYDAYCGVHPPGPELSPGGGGRTWLDYSMNSRCWPTAAKT